MRPGHQGFRIGKPLFIHFTTEPYCVFTTHNRIIGTNEDAFSRRPDQKVFYAFEKLFSEELAMGFFLVANYVEGHFDAPFTIGADDYERYDLWRARRQALTYRTRNDIILLSENLNKPFTDALSSSIFKQGISGNISPETVVLLDRYHPFLDEWKEQLKSTMFADIILRWRKYRRFVKGDPDKIAPLVNWLEEATQ